MVLIRFSASVAVAAVLTTLSRLYMLQLRVPSVISVRPELADVGVVTGIFSGRGTIYLWYHYPNAMSGSMFIIIGVLVFLSSLSTGVAS